MRVPEALIERRTHLEQECYRAIEKQREAAAAAERVNAQLAELEAAIAVIEGAEASILDVPVFQPVAKTPAEMVERGSVLDGMGPSNTRAPRRNIKELVREYIAEDPGPRSLLSAKELADALDCQMSSIENALEKLRVENPKSYVASFSVAPEAVPGEITGRPVLVEADLMTFLRSRPEGANFAELEKYGLSSGVSAGILDSAIWQDARGYYHAAPALTGAEDEEIDVPFDRGNEAAQ